MAEIIYTPTPPPADLGPFVTFHLPSGLTGVDEVSIVPGYFEGIPQIWRLHTSWVELTTDATVANRSVNIHRYLDLLATMKAEFYRGAALAASSTGYFAINSLKFTYGGFFSSAVIAGVDNLIIRAFEKLKISIGTGKAGDVFSGNITLEYLNPKYGMRDPYTPGKGG